MNYTSLTTLLEQYLENEEASYIANIPLFIRLCEEDVYRTVKLQAAGLNVTSTFAANSPYLGLPSGYLSPNSMAVVVGANYQYLLLKDVDFMREAFPDPTATGTPRYYAQFDDVSFIVGPTPPGNYTVELHYFGQPESITTTLTGTTWLGDNAENAILFGSLMHGYIYMKGDQDVMVSYKGQFDKAINDLKTVIEAGSRMEDYR